MRFVMRVRYRVWQLWRALTGRLDHAEYATAQRLLTPAEYALFLQMPSYDQRHSMDVVHTLGQLGARDSELLAMALLHDIGKVGDDGRSLSLWWYGWWVLLRRVTSLRMWALSRFEPLRRCASHEQRSAAVAAAAGARAEVVALLHQVAIGGEDVRLRVFAEADDQC